ncbi:hypothetical protein JCM16303_005345 [Sporobolomyces ruberrimus]
MASFSGNPVQIWRDDFYESLQPNVLFADGSAARQQIRKDAVDELVREYWVRNERQAQAFWMGEIEIPILAQVVQEGEGGIAAQEGFVEPNHREEASVPSTNATSSARTRGWQPDAQWIYAARSGLSKILEVDSPQKEINNKHRIATGNGITHMVERGMDPIEASLVWARQVNEPVAREFMGVTRPGHRGPVRNIGNIPFQVGRRSAGQGSSTSPTVLQPLTEAGRSGPLRNTDFYRKARADHRRTLRRQAEARSALENNR